MHYKYLSYLLIGLVLGVLSRAPPVTVAWVFWLAVLPILLFSHMVLNLDFGFQRISSPEDIYETLMVTGVAVGVSAFHFVAQWNKTYRIIVRDAGAVLLEKMLMVSENGFPTMSELPSLQINNYTGHPFFLQPFVEMFGYTPLSIRVALVGSAAVSTGLFFLTYRRLFDLKKAVVGILLLLTMRQYVYYRWFDYTYTLLLCSVLFYLYVIYRKNPQNHAILYFTAYLTGAFIYFKATVALLAAALASGFLSTNRSSYALKKTAPCLLLLLTGALPFIGYNVLYFDDISTNQRSSNKISPAGPENLSYANALLGRFDQLGRWMVSDAYRMENLLSAKDKFLPPSFVSDRAPGSVLQRPLSVESFLTGKDYKVHKRTGFHPLSAILILGSLGLVISKSRNRDLAVIWSSFLALMVFLPSSSAFRVSHMHVLVPFTIPVFLALEDLMPEHLGFHKTIKNTIYLSLCIVLGLAAVLMYLNVPDVDEPGQSEFRTSEDWGGTSEFYQDFESIETTEDILTDSIKVKRVSSYSAGRGTRLLDTCKIQQRSEHAAGDNITFIIDHGGETDQQTCRAEISRDLGSIDRYVSERRRIGSINATVHRPKFVLK